MWLSWRTAASPAIYHLVDCYARWGDWATIAAELLGVDVEIALSSPTASKNMFDTENVSRDLDVRMDRGLDGIRQHLAAMIALQEAEGADESNG